MKRRAEPFWWSLFGAGGVMSAMFLPVLLLFFGFAVPFGWIDVPAYEGLRTLLDMFLVKLLLFAIVALSFFHWAHRFRFTLYEGLQLHRFSRTIAFLCYGIAILLSVFACYVMFVL